MPDPKRSEAAKKAAQTRKRKAAGRKAALTRKRKAAARKAAETRKARAQAKLDEDKNTFVIAASPWTRKPVKGGIEAILDEIDPPNES